MPQKTSPATGALIHTATCGGTAGNLQCRCNTFAVLLQLPCSVTAKGMRKACSMEGLIDKYLYNESPMGSNVQ